MTNKKQKTIDFHYVKTPGYRLYNVDGIFGGVTPQGKFYFDVFSERNPLPEKISHKITEQGIVGGEISRKTLESGVIRQIECGLIMNINTATSIHKWLGEKLKDIKTQVEKFGSE